MLFSTVKKEIQYYYLLNMMFLQQPIQYQGYCRFMMLKEQLNTSPMYDRSIHKYTEVNKNCLDTTASTSKTWLSLSIDVLRSRLTDMIIEDKWMRGGFRLKTSHVKRQTTACRMPVPQFVLSSFPNSFVYFTTVRIA